MFIVTESLHEALKADGLVILPRKPTIRMMAAMGDAFRNPDTSTWSEVYKAMMAAWEKQRSELKD